MKYLIKESGERERFDKKKIEHTCIKAGASRQLAKEIANKVEKRVYNGMRSRKVLRLILKLLKTNPEIALKYDLKRAIMSLGPDGYFFEEFFSQILQNYGYETSVGVFLKGKIIEHEVDIIAKKKLIAMIECKYHNHLGNYTKSKEAMYTYAKFLDLKSNKQNKIDYPWLVTNTKCSPHAKQYAKGVKLKITSWNYPNKESLQKLIENKKLYPITILKSVNNHIKDSLFKVKIVLAKDLLNRDINKLAKKTSIDERRLRKIISEISQTHLS